MTVILLEIVLFAALIAVAGAVAFRVLDRFTPIGAWRRQVRNRRLLERAALTSCPIHGPRAERELVRLPSGERICPECYKEALQ